jgi:hypothetical protein
VMENERATILMTTNTSGCKTHVDNGPTAAILTGHSQQGQRSKMLQAIPSSCRRVDHATLCQL